MKSIIDQLTFDPDEAAIFLNRSRYMLVRPETLAALGRAAGEKAGKYFFTAGREGGRLAAQNYFEKQNMDPEATVRFMLDAGGAIGWAKMNLITFDPGVPNFQVHARSSALDWPGGAGWQLLAGVLSGLGEVVFNKAVTVAQSPLQAPNKGILFTVLGIAADMDR